MLSLQHLTVVRGSKTVLRDASLDVEPNDVVCLLGEEGSGKTTLLKLLTRELQPNEGVIKIDGAILAQLPREVLRMFRARVGFLDEHASLDDTLTIAQNIGLPLDLVGTERALRDRAVGDLLKRLRITSIAKAFPQNVSRGERQLAALARSIAAGPLIVLLDEPFQGVSDDAARIAASMLQNMCKKGATVIVASAEERTLSFFASPRVARLQRGKMTEETPTHKSSSTKVREATAIVTTELVEKQAMPSTDEVVESIESNDKKKIRITAVGSL